VRTKVKTPGTGKNMVGEARITGVSHMVPGLFQSILGIKENKGWGRYLTHHPQVGGLACPLFIFPG
jgi:hypothetical protein